MRTIEFRFRARTNLTPEQIHEIVMGVEEEEFHLQLEDLFDYVRVVDVETGDDGVFEYVPESCIAQEVVE